MGGLPALARAQFNKLPIAKRSEATYCPQIRLDKNLEYRYGRQL